VQSASSPVTGLATQCYFDIVLVPLPTWIFMALALAVFPLAVPAPLYQSLHHRPYKRRWHRILNLAGYYGAIAVVVLMQSVEVAGLARINFGLGLVPVVYVGCALAAALQATKGLWGRLRGWEFANILFWFLSFIISIVKLAALSKLPSTEAFRRENGSYGVSHQINDIAIMLVFYIVLAALEIGLLFCKPWSQNAEEGTRLMELNEYKS
jgi:hypothetical protein